jgi:hypothetical protein
MDTTTTPRGTAAATLARVGGTALALTAVGSFAAGFLHPHGGTGGFRQTIAGFLADPAWSMAHWAGLVTMLLTAWAVWVLIDSGAVGGAPAALLGSRLALVGALVMTVEMAVEIAAGAAAEVYASGAVVPLVGLVDPLQAVGWPAYGFGFALLALRWRAAAPRWVAIVGAVGFVAMGLGGILVQGLHILALGPLFAGGNLT